MWYAYALISELDGNLYIGISEDPIRRLKDHNSGMSKSTRSRRPFVLIFQEECGSRIDARKREKWLKTGCGREFLKQFKQNK